MLNLPLLQDNDEEKDRQVEEKSEVQSDERTSKHDVDNPPDYLELERQETSNGDKRSKKDDDDDDDDSVDNDASVKWSKRASKLFSFFYLSLIHI